MSEIPETPRSIRESFTDNVALFRFRHFIGMAQQFCMDNTIITLSDSVGRLGLQGIENKFFFYYVLVTLADDALKTQHTKYLQTSKDIYEGLASAIYENAKAIEKVRLSHIITSAKNLTGIFIKHGMPMSEEIKRNFTFNSEIQGMISKEKFALEAFPLDL